MGLSASAHLISGRIPGVAGDSRRSNTYAHVLARLCKMLSQQLLTNRRTRCFAARHPVRVPGG